MSYYKKEITGSGLYKPTIKQKLNHEYLKRNFEKVEGLEEPRKFEREMKKDQEKFQRNRGKGQEESE